MAKDAGTNQALQWGHTPMGEFYINVVIPTLIDGKGMEDGSPYLVPLHSFVLTKDEEDSLKAMLSGVVVAKTIPKSNGHGLKLVQ